MRVRVCFGSLAEVPARRRRVRFTPDSGHPLAPEKCRLWAKSGREQVAKASAAASFRGCGRSPA